MDSKDKNTQKNKFFVASVEFAIQGLKTVVKEERNMRKHVFVGILVILASFIFKLNLQEWLWILLAVFLVIVMEIVNTTFENVVDMVTNYHFHPIGKRVKDMAAGAVLLTSFFAAVVGVIIFLPKVWLLLQNWIK
ncbi:undecaprenol kinase [Enterococcus sp. PF1-24]|uniref:diacylglycerol kinase family protein n=1 Tax=unclassified Enterococcus TaxID=2608891 RepID=UPI0024768CDC|nr:MULTISPECIES: diacylglycerol kinase family protein [unclassified Enterococcus]MDH6365117.1 undecaprenol kinase [Enterococcus sp. PFB1-1]MDH6402218.1 undecaprenol kinase [Enterococcus sp. PF1-24]